MKQYYFRDINLDDPFFSSLKEDYPGFSEWYNKKEKDGARAFIQKDEKDIIQGFLYMKQETEELSDIVPPMPSANRLKIGTFKIDAHNTKLGEYFVKKIITSALYIKAEEIYVTIYPKHEGLIRLLQRYGFTKYGKKGGELVFVRKLKEYSNDLLMDYPFIHTTGKSKFVLPIRPEYHTQLFPDSILNTEQRNKDFLVRDVTYTNSIHKIYVCKMNKADQLQKGDVLLVYRTNDGRGPAHYRSVISSACVVEEIKKASDFSSVHDFVRYANTYSIFNEDELKSWYNQEGMIIIKMTYNAAFDRRVIRAELINEVGLPENQYWGFLRLTDEQFNNIISRGKINESIIIN